MNGGDFIARVRRALDPGAEAVQRARGVSERLANPPRYPRPAFACLNGREREARFISCLEASGTEVFEIDEISALPDAIETLLGRMVPQPRFWIADDPRLTSFSWRLAPAVWQSTEALGDGHAALTHATGGVAETGTMVMGSSAATPASLAFLPELHLVAVDRGTIAASFEDVFASLSAGAAKDRLPRAVNLISGPSRTGDIGGRIVKGAHGPRRLAVIIYGKPG